MQQLDREFIQPSFDAWLRASLIMVMRENMPRGARWHIRVARPFVRPENPPVVLADGRRIPSPNRRSSGLQSSGFGQTDIRRRPLGAGGEVPALELRNILNSVGVQANIEIVEMFSGAVLIHISQIT